MKNGVKDMKHHDLDLYPLPKGKAPLFINEPWLIDTSIAAIPQETGELELEDDNVRVYIPLDISRKAILRRVHATIARYGEANEENEVHFQIDMEAIISQVEIYDQIWFVRHMPSEGKHSLKAIELVQEMISCLEEIPDGCAEIFPFETISSLENEYLGCPTSPYPRGN